MSKEQKITSSVYRKIALDIASNIVNGKYVEGEKLFGRSVLASQYGVSPETIRKSVYLLKDIGILDSEKGSGVEVKSIEKAQAFLDHYSQLDSMETVKNEIKLWAQNQIKETTAIIDRVQFIVDSAARIKNVTPFAPYEIKITEAAAVIGHTTSELQFWHNTGGTIIAIKRGETLTVSPGPYATFCDGDIFYVIGDEHAYAASLKLIYG